MGKDIVVISHPGKERLNELMTRLILLKLTNEVELEKCYSDKNVANIHQEK